MSALLSPRTLERLSRLDLATRRAAGGGNVGERSSGTAGVGTLFREHRTYTHGDDLRYVDWNVYGRLRELNVKVFEREENIDAHILLDRSASMGEGPGSKLETGLRVAAALGAVGLTHGATARVQAFPTVPRMAQLAARSAFRGRSDVHALVRAISSIPGGGREPLGTALRPAFPRLRRRGLALLMTDFLDPPDGPGGWRRAIDFLHHRRVRLAVVHVIAPEERDPGLVGAARFIDAETGEEVLIDVDENVRRAYRLHFERHVRAVGAYLRAKEARHVVIDAGLSEEALVRRLLAMGLLR